MASTARRISISAPPIPPPRSRAAFRSASAGSSAPRPWTSRTRRTGPRSTPTSRSTAAPSPACSSACATATTRATRSGSSARDRSSRAPVTPRTTRTRSRTIRPTSTASADRSRGMSGTGRPAQLAAYNSSANVNRDPVATTRLDRPVPGRGKELRPRTRRRISRAPTGAGNIGVRFVQTEEDIVSYVSADPYRSGCDPGLGFRHVQAGARRTTRTTTGCRAPT